MDILDGQGARRVGRQRQRRATATPPHSDPSADEGKILALPSQAPPRGGEIRLDRSRAAPRASRPCGARSSPTTKLYDRTDVEIILDEVERMMPYRSVHRAGRCCACELRDGIS